MIEQYNEKQRFPKRGTKGEPKGNFFKSVVQQQIYRNSQVKIRNFGSPQGELQIRYPPTDLRKSSGSSPFSELLYRKFFHPLTKKNKNNNGHTKKSMLYVSHVCIIKKKGTQGTFCINVLSSNGFSGSLLVPPVFS